MEYKININRVVDVFLSLSDDVELGDGRVFCLSATDTVQSWLDLNKEPQKHDYEICYAAGTIAFYRYILKLSGNADTFKAGDITVTDCSEKTVDYAKQLMSDALLSIEPYLKSRRFAFIGTEVE